MLPFLIERCPLLGCRTQGQREGDAWSLRDVEKSSPAGCGLPSRPTSAPNCPRFSLTVGQMLVAQAPLPKTGLTGRPTEKTGRRARPGTPGFTKRKNSRWLAPELILSRIFVDRLQAPGRSSSATNRPPSRLRATLGQAGRDAFSVPEGQRGSSPAPEVGGVDAPRGPSVRCSQTQSYRGARTKYQVLRTYQYGRT